jgi:NAD(P)H-dependent FMN reductase
MPKLCIVVASTRPNRAGLSVAEWFVGQAKAHGGFDVELADLKEINLPFLDEPKHPRLRDYQHEHTRKWSAIVDASDAFVFVTPEYNFGAAPALLNALDYLFHEWSYKPAGFVSYGAGWGGVRSVQMTKLLLTSLKIVPIPEAVAAGSFRDLMDPSGVFRGSELLAKSAETMLGELVRWSGALKALRARTPLGSAAS